MRTKTVEKAIRGRARKLRTEAEERGKTRPGASHRGQPAGTKLARRFMKAKTGTKAKTGAEARAWYRAYRP